MIFTNCTTLTRTDNDDANYFFPVTCINKSYVYKSVNDKSNLTLIKKYYYNNNNLFVDNNSTNGVFTLVESGFVNTSNGFISNTRLTARLKINNYPETSYIENFLCDMKDKYLIEWEEKISSGVIQKTILKGNLVSVNKEKYLLKDEEIETIVMKYKDIEKIYLNGKIEKTETRTCYKRYGYKIGLIRQTYEFDGQNIVDLELSEIQ
jgi:hypothetical protein